MSLRAGAPAVAGLVALALSFGVTASPVRAQTPFGIVPAAPAGVGSDTATEQVSPAAVDAQASTRGEFVIAPLPIVNPTLENGLALVAGYLYRIDADDHTTAPSVTGVGGFKTSNDSWAASLIQSLHLGHDRFRVLGIAGYADINYEFFGIGQSAGESGRSIALNQVGWVGMLEGLVRFAPGWYAGARYQMLKMTVDARGVAPPDGPTVPALDVDLRTASLGPRLDYDSRDNPFYPRRGMQVRGIVNLYGEGVGGRRSYQTYDGWVNRYYSAGSRNVIAWHLGACGADESVPFYDLCLLGKSRDLRGYTAGQYRDRAMVAAQAEWRSELWWRFGAAAFVGAGAVAPAFEALSWANVLPGSGAGLRFTLAKRNHVNLRVDYAWGKDSTALYVGVAEAF